MASCKSTHVWQGGQHRCAFGDPHSGDHGTMVGEPGTASYKRISWPNERDRDLKRGCCSACAGTGGDTANYETGGRCWDCYGTGHAHPLSEKCE
jgi:hypothetical protein